MTRAAVREAAAPAGPPALRPVIGVLWGDFPWEEPPRRLGPLLSWGVVARLTSQALRSVGTVLPYLPPPADAAPEAHRAALAAFLHSIDLLWADVYPASAPAIMLRHELGLPCRALLLAGGAMPKGAEAMLFPWRGWLRPGDGLLFTCEADRAIWRGLTRRSLLSEWVAPCGVDDDVFTPRPAADRRATRRQLGLPPGAPLLLYVGRLNIQKNLHGLLRLFAAVRRQLPDARLVLVGEEDNVGLHEFGALNTGYVASVRALAAELGVADALIFLGPRFGEELARVYAAADLLVNLSFYHRENFGLAQAEAQACGTPVVCSAWGGFKEVVRHGETGYLVEAVLTGHGIRVDWATAAEHAVALLRDPARRAAMGRRAAAWARERFGLAALGRSLGEVVAELARPAAMPIAGARLSAQPIRPSLRGAQARLRLVCRRATGDVRRARLPALRAAARPLRHPARPRLAVGGHPGGLAALLPRAHRVRPAPPASPDARSGLAAAPLLPPAGMGGLAAHRRRDDDRQPRRRAGGRRRRDRPAGADRAAAPVASRRPDPVRR